MTTAAPTRPDGRPLLSLRPGSVVPVSGISFRQDAARMVQIGDEVRLTHDVSNPYDQYAVSITTVAGEVLGFVPKTGLLNARLVMGHAGGIWGGVVVDRYDGETIGLRVQVNVLLGHRDATYGSDEPGIREVDTPAPQPAPAADPDQPTTVTGPSGRLLGTLVDVADGKVRVRTPAGRTVAYPDSVVSIDSPVPALTA